MNTWTSWARPSLACVILLFAALPGAVRAVDWLPISPDDLRMKAEPKAPAAPAIILYRQVDRDDDNPGESVYVRIKILTEEGRKYADVEIPYWASQEAIRNVEARSIRPDGTVTNFDGTIYSKQILKAGELKVDTKTFTLPDVEVGGIIEYRYRHSLTQGFVFDSRWVLSDELFTRQAKFSLVPSTYFGLRWNWPAGLPENTSPPAKEGRLIRLEVRDVPAFVPEDFMPPGDTMKYRVDFIYESAGTPEKDPTKFWKAVGKQRFSAVEHFIANHRALEEAVKRIVEPSDAPEVKLRKIYARVQQIRNTSFESEKTAAEEKRESPEEVRSAEQLLGFGRGDGIQITWLFLGLVRAAGIQADAALIPSRDRYFFNALAMNTGELNTNAVIAKVDGAEMFFDPGTPFAPFGLLPWFESGVTALRLEKDGGGWVQTPLSKPGVSRVARVAVLQLDASGTLHGNVTVTYTGLEGQWRRLTALNEDDGERKELLEGDLQRAVPTGIHVQLTNSPDWNSSDAPLVAEFTLSVPGWVAAAGRRGLMPVSLFGGDEQHIFEHSARSYPLYFHFPYQHDEDVQIQLPADWQVGNMPKARGVDLKVAQYAANSEYVEGSLRLRRELTWNLMLAKTQSYGPIRDFFQTVRTGDQDQIVLTRAAR